MKPTPNASQLSTRELPALLDQYDKRILVRMMLEIIKAGQCDRYESPTTQWMVRAAAYALDPQRTPHPGPAPSPE